MSEESRATARFGPRLAYEDFPAREFEREGQPRKTRATQAAGVTITVVFAAANVFTGGRPRSPP